MDISLRRASEEDIPFLLLLRDKTMRQYLEEAGIPTNPAKQLYLKLGFEFVENSGDECLLELQA